MIKVTKREYKRWIMINGELKGREIYELAGELNLQIIQFWTPSLCVWYHCKAKGTSEDIKEFDTALRNKGHTVKNRRPAGGFEI